MWCMVDVVVWGVDYFDVGFSGGGCCFLWWCVNGVGVYCFCYVGVVLLVGYVVDVEKWKVGRYVWREICCYCWEWIVGLGKCLKC